MGSWKCRKLLFCVAELEGRSDRREGIWRAIIREINLQPQNETWVYLALLFSTKEGSIRNPHVNELEAKVLTAQRKRRKSNFIFLVFS